MMNPQTDGCNKSDGVTGKLKESGETVAFPVDLSASKVSPEFMRELKKTVRENVTDALEAEDLLPKPLPVVENR